MLPQKMLPIPMNPRTVGHEHDPECLEKGRTEQTQGRSKNRSHEGSCGLGASRSKETEQMADRPVGSLALCFYLIYDVDPVGVLRQRCR